MSYIQQYLPIINQDTKVILGMFNLGSNVTFVGDETTYDLGDAEVSLVLWEPTPSLIRKVNPAFMAAVFTREEVLLKQHRCSSKYSEVNANLPAYGNRSTSALANIRDIYDGPIVGGLAESFGVGIANLVPQNTVAPAITGTVQEGETLTCSDGTWTNSPDSYTKQWYRDGLPLAGETGDTYDLVTADVGDIMACYVYAVNVYGSKGKASNNTVVVIAA